MKKSAVLLVGILSLFSLQIFAQEGKPGDTKSKVIYTEVFEKGNSLGQIVESKVEYDQQGNILKEYDYNKEGKLKGYIVYTYKGNKKETETLYSADNKVIEKNVYAYNSKGDRISKITYNGANKMIKKKIYSYEYF